MNKMTRKTKLEIALIAITLADRTGNLQLKRELVKRAQQLLSQKPKAFATRTVCRTFRRVSGVDGVYR